MLSPNTILHRRYRIIQELGRGGMGAVYQAMDENLNCVVAVKEAFAESQEQRRAFRREAELLANLRHPALPKVMEVFSENDRDFLAMEFIPGHDLAELLALRRGPFPESDVLSWADELLNVLNYLHGKQLLHRDIKPSNVKLTKEGELFLIDFGLAKGAAGQMPTVVSTKSVHGYTPQYASREQILGEGTDARSDIYSLGATLYHLLTGVAPIDASTRFRAMKDEGRDPLTLIQSENPLVSPHVASIVHSAMEISPERRPASALEMRNALRGLPVGQPARRKSPSPAAPPRPTEPSPRSSSPSTPPISTLPAGARPSEPPPYGPRIFSTNDVPPDERPQSGGSFVKPFLIGIGCLVLLAVLSFVAVALKTGWVPWSDKNLYSETQAPDSINSNGSTTSVSPSPSRSPALSLTPKAGTVVKNKMGMDLVYIPSGSFMMGSENGDPNEKPVHGVTFSKGFYMGKYEVTQAQWQAVIGNNPSYFQSCGGNCPVEHISWDSVQEFIKDLNARNDGYAYRLPSEAEWEYAARAGATTNYYWGDDPKQACRYENVGDQTGKAKYPVWKASVDCSDEFPDVAPVGSFLPNKFGLYDMAGNVSEWCEDRFHSDHTGAPADGSVRGEDFLRYEGMPLYSGLVRGAAWGPDQLGRIDPRPAVRNVVNRSDRGNYIGFRLVAMERTR
jgi:formylglycine-generating enzyme required for sulfatase activity/predicted Ser/Thr protein kinase